MTDQPNLFDDAKRKPKKLKTEYEQKLFQALCDVCGWSVKHLSATSRGRVNVAVKSLKEAKPTPEEVIRVGHAIKSRWPDCELTPSSIDANWTNFVDAKPAPATGVNRPSRKEVEERETEQRATDELFARVAALPKDERARLEKKVLATSRYPKMVAASEYAMVHAICEALDAEENDGN